MSRAQSLKIFSLVNYPIVINESLMRLIGVFVFMILMSLGAFVRIPLFFTPVPITLQTFFVLLSGVMLGKRFGVVSQIGYLALGAAGLPVFAGAACGMGYLAGPSGGYLIGFVAASFIAAFFLEGRNNFHCIIGAFLISTAVIYLFGSTWLALYMKINWKNAFFMGILPFIAADMLKLLTAAVIYEKLKFRFGN